MLAMGFDFNQIAINLGKNMYECIGSGSARKVFDLRNGYVVKVAKSKRGILQNRAEYNISLNESSNLLAKVYDISEDYSFVIMEKAEKIQHISYVWKYFNVKNNRELYKLSKIRNLYHQHRLMIKDFGRAVNWGKINNRPVIIDYGFTRHVQNYYKMSLFRLR